MIEKIKDMKDEYDDLNEKITKLKDFIYNDNEFIKLKRKIKLETVKQLGFMEAYRDALGRIILELK